MKPSHARPDGSFWASYGLACTIAVLFILWVYPEPLDFLQGRGAYFEVGDTPQHVTAWLLYAKDDWHWPLLLTRMIDPQNGVHIALTDSIPLAALLFKPFYHLLPENFHYFGIWHLVNKVLQAVGAVFLVRSFGRRDALTALAAAALALLWPTSLMRLQHTALGAQGLLLFGLGFYFRALYGRWSAVRIVIAFATLSLVSLLIHPYLFAMIFPMLLALAVDRTRHGESVIGSAFTIVATTVTVLSVAVVLGYGSNGAARAGGFEIYSMNLLSPFCGGPLAFCALPDATGGQYEGFNYLGAGTLLLVLGALLTFRGRPAMRWLTEHVGLILVMAGFVVFALSSAVYVGHARLLSYSLLWPFTELASIFRASGRFFWPVGYAIALLALVRVSRCGPSVAITVIVTALGLQWMDTAGLRNDTNNILSAERLFDYSGWSTFEGRIQHIEVWPAYGCAPIDNMRYIYFQTVAARLGVSINTGYVARHNLACEDQPIEPYVMPDTLHVNLGAVAGLPASDAHSMDEHDDACVRWSEWDDVVLCSADASRADWEHIGLR